MQGIDAMNGLDTRRRAVLGMLEIPLWRRRGTAVSSPQADGIVAEAEIGTLSRPIEAPRVRGREDVGLDWDTLAGKVASCTACGLHATRTQTVFGVGNRQAEWMVIGEAPGADEDKQGEPFVGRAGQLLNAMLRAAGLRREQVYIANILKCRPPDNRDPQADEVACCEPFLTRQIELIQPKLILAVGRIAAHNLLKTDIPLGKLRGRMHHYAPTGTPVVITYHPAYLLRSPGEKRKAWEDLQFARTVANCK
jgi:DNA polymerase